MIVTFYSYKGGTGRTMALANIAVLLARAGRRVLMVDFDLEAPGIWRYFADLARGLDQRPGLMDMLIDHVRRWPTHPKSSPLAGATYADEIDWRRYVTPVPISGKRVDLLASGRQDPGYPARVLDFDWPDFFESYEGGRFIERLRAEWQADYDFVLIDSRTGITDIGGICTIALPDLIVPVFVANAQNVDGVVDVIRRAQRGRQDLAYDRPPALVLPVLSRFDNRTELEFANEWMSIAANRLGEFYADWLPTGIEPRALLERTKLPHVAYFGFGEKLAVLLQGVNDPDSLGYALSNVATLIDSRLADLSKVLPDAESPSSSPGTRRSPGPREDSWIAAVHDGDIVRGAAFAIDRKRLLTAGHVVARGIHVTFPKSTVDESFPVSAISRSTDRARYDVAILHLERPLPPEISPAPLRFVSPADLVGTEWWAFGFPANNPVGGTSRGTIAETLGYGILELADSSHAAIAYGFSGAPLWSSEHDAVVGLVLGQGHALPLDRADTALPDAGLRLLGNPFSGSVRLSRRQREALIDVLRILLHTKGAAEDFLRGMDYPVNVVPRYEAFSSPALFWDQILTELEVGIIPGGVGRLVEQLVLRYPGNRSVNEIMASLRSSGSYG